MGSRFEITTENIHQFLRRFVQPKLSFVIEEILKRDEVR